MLPVCCAGSVLLPTTSFWRQLLPCHGEPANLCNQYGLKSSLVIVLVWSLVRRLHLSFMGFVLLALTLPISAWTKQIVKSMLTARSQRFSDGLHLHGRLVLQQICHRDLKLENTLLDGSPAPRLKICDFGYSKVCTLRLAAPLDHIVISKSCSLRDGWGHYPCLSYG